MMAANSNPHRITEPMWQLWESRPVPAWKLGGIYANKSGYHNSRAANQQSWPGNYSIRLSLDLQGPGDKAAAIDYTMSDAEMRLRTGYLVAAADRRDPRLYAVREFYGTTNSKTVAGRIKASRTGEWQLSSADSTHLWHIHISFFRAYVTSWAELGPVLSVLAGETLAQWQAKQNEQSGGMSMLCKEGDKGDHVRALQFLLNELGASPALKTDGAYGSATAAGLKQVRGTGDGAEYGPKTYVELHTKLAAKHGGKDGARGPAGPAGPPGPPGRLPAEIRITGTATVEAA